VVRPSSPAEGCGFTAFPALAAFSGFTGFAGRGVAFGDDFFMQAV